MPALTVPKGGPQLKKTKLPGEFSTTMPPSCHPPPELFPLGRGESLTVRALSCEIKMRKENFASPKFFMVFWSFFFQEF